MEEKKDIVLEAGKYLIRGLLLLQFNKDEIMEILDMLIEEYQMFEMIKWIKQESQMISKLIELDKLDEVKGLIFDKVSEIANGNTNLEIM